MGFASHRWRLSIRALAACGGLACAAWAALPAAGQLRIVDYNIAQNSEFNADPTGLNTILSAIGGEVRNGFARPIDVMANQELDDTGMDAAFIVGQLNSLYGAGTYAAAPIPSNAETGGNGLPSLIYNQTTVTLLDTLAFGEVGSGVDEQPRSTLRYHLRPVGYDASADFYIYNSHYKADDEADDKARRLIEATSIRANADALGEGLHALYVGDYNIKSSGEDMYVQLLSAGPGQAQDPLDASEVNGSDVTWSGNGTYVGIHTQSPRATSQPVAFTGQVRGGMDDRFDFQLTTSELLDGEGLSMIGGSYRTFGNNGTHAINGSISTGTGAAANVLTALSEVSDHMPVVAEYQLPAKLGVQVASIPPTVGLGAAASVNVMVQNLAAALITLGADELDYTLSVTGDLIGGLTGTAQTLGAANSHPVTLNTSTLGLKSGTINVLATSQGAADAMFSLPVSFTVVGGGGIVRTTIARDNFDAPLNLTSFVQTPTAGVYTVLTSGFQKYQVGVSSTIPFALVDDTLHGFPTDSQGIINAAVKTDGWFGVTDTLDNTEGGPVNPGGECVATWNFNVAGASALEVSIDMGAMGDFEATGVNRDRFDWTYSLDGGAFSPLFTSSVNEAIDDVPYMLADGDVLLVDDPLVMTNRASQTVQLSNVLQTITSAVPGVGSSLQVRLTAKTDGTTEAYAFDNILVTGLVANFLEADFNNDGAVNATDLTAWKTNFGLTASAMKSQGDADADGDVDGVDFLTWQRQLTIGAAASAAGAAVPELGSVVLAALGALGGQASSGAAVGPRPPVAALWHWRRYDVECETLCIISPQLATCWVWLPRACCRAVASPAAAQLRIVTYNTTGGPRSGMDFILTAIGQEVDSGGAETIDVLLLQEQSRSTGLPDTQAFVTLLNSIYAGQGITYARGAIIGGGDDTQSIVYKTNTVTLMEEVTVGTTSFTGQPRQTIRHKLKPAGYDDSAAFYVYNSHYKASQGTDDTPGAIPNATRRLVEANAIRANSNALGAGVHAIYAGDLNFYDFDADEPAFGVLTAAGNGQAIDPINRVGTWHNSFSFRDVHTQSPTTTQRFGGQASGGVDDRFDFQLVTDDFLDGEGLSYISGTYRAFGNNGTTFNLDTDSGFNTYPFDLVTFDAQHTRTQLLEKLSSVTDHLPVIADYRVPAMMDVDVAAIPMTVNLGASISILVTVENIAPIRTAVGADELDYTLSVSGDLVGGITDLDPAGGGGHDHDVFLNTSTPGLKSGVISVVATSPQAAHATFSMPVSFNVLGPSFLAADFNEDTQVDGLDFESWAANLGIVTSAAKSQGDANADGDVDGEDFLTWQQQRGSPPPGIVVTAVVPEPAGLAIAALGLAVGDVGGAARSAAADLRVAANGAGRPAERDQRSRLYGRRINPGRWWGSRIRIRATSSRGGRARCGA